MRTFSKLFTWSVVIAVICIMVYEEPNDEELVRSVATPEFKNTPVELPDNIFIKKDTVTKYKPNWVDIN